MLCCAQVRKVPGDHDQRVSDLLELVQLTGLGDRWVWLAGWMYMCVCVCLCALRAACVLLNQQQKCATHTLLLSEGHQPDRWATAVSVQWLFCSYPCAYSCA